MYGVDVLVHGTIQVLVFQRSKGISVGCLKIKKILCLISMLVLVVAFCFYRTPRTMIEVVGKFVMSDKVDITDGSTGQKIILNEEERAELFQILKATRICGRKRYEPSGGYCKAIGLFYGNGSLSLILKGDEIEAGYGIWNDVFAIDDENNQRIREFIGM